MLNPTRANTSAHGSLASAFGNNAHDWQNFGGPIVRDSKVCSIEGDPAPVVDDTPKFTQKDFDTQLGKRLAEERKKVERFADYDAVKAQKSEIEAELAKLRDEKEMAGKSAEEKQKIEADKAAKAIERERTEWGTKLTVAEKRALEAETKYRTRTIREELGAGLDGAKVLTSARAKAVKAFMDEATIELDDNDVVSSITYGGVAHKSVADAAAQFLKDNDFFASAGRPTGGGTQPPNTGSHTPPADGSAVSLLSSGLAARRNK